MGTTMVSDIDGGHCPEKKSMIDELKKECPEDLHSRSKASTDFGDMTVLSNPDASTGRMESSSPIQSLRKFARTPEKTKDTSGEENSGTIVTEAGDQGQEHGANGELKKKLNCSLRESKAREARSRVVVEKFEKKILIDDDEIASDEASEDGIPINIRHKFRKEFGGDLLEKLFNCDQKKTLKSPDDRRRSKSAHRAQRKMTRFSDTDCGKGRASSATRMENYTSRFRMNSTENLDPEELTLHRDSHCSKEPIQAVPREDMANGRQLDPELHLTDLLKEVWVHKTYQQLGHCLRANAFPGVAMPMQTISQESYTKEVNDKGRVEKSKAEHWHGKKADPLGQWHERNFSNLNLIKALQQKNQDKLAKN